MSVRAISLSPLFGLLFTISIFIPPSTAAVDSFLYGGCSPMKYNPGTPYESNVNSIMSSIVNSASFTTYNTFKISVPGSSSSDVVYGLFQCRGDLSNSDCRYCVARAVSQLGVLCVDSTGGAIQLDGCLVKYDNVTFIGVEDKTVVLRKCGPLIGYDGEELSRRDSVLDYLASGGQFFRVSGSGRVRGVAQCVQDLSPSQCQDCLGEAIRRLKNDCQSAAWGDMFLGKCYARYTERRDGSDNVAGSHEESNDDEVEKTLAILIGLIAGIALLVVFLSFLNKVFENKDGK
ncbi:hypothetical protein NMG60_11018768 [Bertholletia excelsa]